MSAATQSDAGWQIERLAGSLGAEIHGVDLAAPSADDIERIKALLVEHQVLFFPDQSLTPDQHVALGPHFGRMEGHPHLGNADGHPELFELRASGGGIADEWHTDLTFRPEPAVMSILHMVQCPPAGGDTMWTSLTAAYDALSAPMKDLCDGLTALHDALPHNRPDQMHIHPVVRVHPVSGKKALYVNSHFTRRIVEMSAGESEALLSYLTRFVAEPQFTVRYRWRKGTIAMWDNRATQHCVLNDFEGERIIQRVTIMGDEVVGAGAPRWDAWLKPDRLSAMSRHDRQLFMYLKGVSPGGQLEVKPEVQDS